MILKNFRRLMQMAKFKVEVTDECIACGACVAQCDNFEMAGDKAKPKKKEIDDIGCNQEAADACPVQAIKVQKMA
jgi:ferredoxin